MHFRLTEKQSLVFETTANEVFFGGSAGPGKTFCNKALAVAVALSVPKAQIGILRNTSKNLKKNYMQGNNSLPDMLYEYIKAKKVSINWTDGVINFDNGAAIHLMHAEHVATTLENLQGLEFVLLIPDEAALIDKDILNYCKSRLRVGSLKIEDPFWAARLPRLQLTSNPGGISHQYLKHTYIDPAPPMTEFKDPDSGNTLIFIPAFARDIPNLDHEAYDRQLKAMGDSLKYKQLAEGDWNAGGAAFFAEVFNYRNNVIPDFDIPPDWRVIRRSFDPGYSSPFGYVITVRVKGHNEIELTNGTTKYFPNDSIIVYREWYGYDGKDLNTGLRWGPEEIAEAIRAKEEAWGLKGKVQPGRADNTLWNAETNFYKSYEKFGITFLRSDKSKGSRVVGAQKIRKMLMNANEIPNEKPGLYFVDKCVHCIATIPTLPTDPSNPDDVVTEGVPDHLYDALRYEVATETYKAGYATVTGL